MALFKHPLLMASICVTAKFTFLASTKVTRPVNCNAKVCCIHLVCTWSIRNQSLCVMKLYGLKIRFNLNWRSGVRLSCDCTLNISPPSFSIWAQLVRDFSCWMDLQMITPSLHAACSFTNSCCDFFGVKMYLQAHHGTHYNLANVPGILTSRGAKVKHMSQGDKCFIQMSE